MRPAAWKKYVFLILLGSVVILGLQRRWAMAAGTLGVLVAWLLWETHERTRFAFVAERRCSEALMDLGADSQALAVSSNAPWALSVSAGPKASCVDLARGVVRWTRDFDKAPLALALRPDGRLLWASATQLHLAGKDGRDSAVLDFEPPPYRQSYKLLLSGDGRTGLLHTPWFIQAFDPDLGWLGPRLGYEEVGHYMKYAVFNPSGDRLYTAGALLLDEEESGGAAMEARWDAWDLTPQGWVNAWRETYESYNNSHLRNLSLSEDGSLLCAEVWQEGYEFRLHRPDGALVWKRAAEKAVLSPTGTVLVWESPFDGIVCSRVADRSTLWTRKFEDHVRFKRPLDDGRCLVVAGRNVLRLGSTGSVEWEAYLRTDPYDFGLGPNGLLACVRLDKAGVLRLPWPA